MFGDILVVIRKELMDLSRDRRTLKSMAGILIGLPLLYIVLIGVISSQVTEQMERTIQAAVVGCTHAPELCDFMRENRVEMTPLNKVDIQLLSERKFDLILSIPDDFQESLGSYQKARIGLWYDEVEERSAFAFKRMNRVLDGYQSTIAYKRAVLRGIDPASLHPIDVEAKSIKPEKGFGFGSVQLFISTLLMACFMGTYHLAVDSVAGEKERNTLESLMQTATPRTSFLLGKWFSIICVGTFGMMLASFVFKFLATGPLQSTLGITSDLPTAFVVKSFLICLPLLFMATGLQLMIGTLSRSVKEAQTYATLLSVLGILPASFSQVLEKMPEAIWIPNLGQTLALIRLGKEQPVNWLACGVASVGTFLLASLFMLVVHRYFHSEKLFRSGS